MNRSISSVLALLCLLATGLRAQNAWLPWQTLPLNNTQSYLLSLQTANDTLYFTASYLPGDVLAVTEHRRLQGSTVWTSQMIWSRPNSTPSPIGDIMDQRDGNQIAIGCPDCDFEDAQGNPLSDVGYVFYGQRTPNGWNFEALPHPGGNPLDFQFKSFGNSVALEGSRVAVSATWKDNGNGYGNVYVYDNVSGNWAATQLPNNPANYVYGVGSRLRAEADLVIASVDSGGSSQQVHVYRFDGSVWNLELIDAPVVNGTINQFGRAVDYNSDRLVVNIDYYDTGTSSYINEVLLYTYNGTAWVQAPNVIPSSAVELCLLADTLVALSYNNLLEIYEASSGIWQLTQTIPQAPNTDLASPQLVPGLLGLAQRPYSSQLPDAVILYRRVPAARVATRVYYDANNNGQRDAGEVVNWSQPVMATDGSNTVTLLNASPSGLAVFDLPIGTHTFSITLPWYQVPLQITEPAAGTYTVTLANNGLHPDTLEFGVYQPPICNGAVYLAQPSAFRPGFDNSMYFIVANVGTQPLQNPVVNIPLPAGYTFAGLSTGLGAFASVNGGILTVTLNDIPPQSHYSAYILGELDASVTLNTQLSFVATLTSDCNPDIAPANNVYTADIIVSNSWDPNDKTVMNHTPGHPDLIAPGLNRLEYRIRFQNTGNDTAFNIVVVDTLEANLRPETFQMLAASHPYSVELVSDNILVWTFNNILLPDSNVNEPGSHGFVLFSIERAAGLPLGTEITNGAAIYFDFNAPVITEPSVVEISTVSGSADAVGAAAGVRAWPNPVRAGQVLSLSAPLTGVVLDAHGRTVRNVQNVTEVPTEGLAPGMYLLRNQNGNALRFVIQ